MRKQQDRDENKRIRKMLRFEQELWDQGVNYVAGVDESGRGPLAGPVVAAAVIFPKEIFIPMVDDSKRLTAEIREFLFDIILKEALDYGIGISEVQEIDRVNIYQASFLAMERALNHLKIKPEHILVDGRAFSDVSIPYTTIVKGDCLCFSIAAASILAKVTRDKIMCKYDARFPQYGFARHKGYATQAHLDAIEKFGFSPVHRKTFHPKRFMNSSLFLFGDAE